jgi:hypothetical protein
MSRKRVEPRGSGHDPVGFGWVPNPEGVQQVLASLPYPGELMAAAPHWMGDGLEGDLMPFLAYYEVECKNPDGTTWKAKGDEPPYKPQPGNDCTAESTSHLLDLLQMMMLADPLPEVHESIVFHRTCTEATYAIGLEVAGMRGDGGCYGAALAKGVHDVGCLPYRDVGEPYEVDGDRLRQWANRYLPAELKPKAKLYAGAIVTRVTTWEESCAMIANRGAIITPSNVGFQTPRDAKGICQRRGRWPHQMFVSSVIRSDGTETVVQHQSWGPNNPGGPRPFKLPSFCFRTLRQDFEAQLAAGDCWGIRLFGGFEKAALPSRWTNQGWAA